MRKASPAIGGNPVIPVPPLAHGIKVPE